MPGSDHHVLRHRSEARRHGQRRCRHVPGGLDTGSTNYPSGNFHLINDGPTTFADIAQWQTGDPPWDIDHEDRPMTDGASDYAGADVP